MLQKGQMWRKAVSGLNKDDRILLAVSGGGDSIALLHLVLPNIEQIDSPGCSRSRVTSTEEFRPGGPGASKASVAKPTRVSGKIVEFDETGSISEQTPDLRKRIVVGHVHHGTGEFADRSEAFVRNQCEELGVECQVARVSIDEKERKALGFEAAARLERYAALERIAKDNGCIRCLTAHTLDDQAESVFIALTRGSGTGGLAGVRKQNGIWYRPLLDYSRDTLIDFLSEHSIPWLDDPMNDDDHYTRVGVRKHLKPLIIKQFGEGAWENIARSAHRISSAHSALEDVAETALKKITYGSINGWISIDAGLLCRYFEDIRERVLKVAYQTAAYALSKTHLTRKQMRQLVGMLKPQKIGKRIQLPAVSVLRTDRFIIFNGIPEDFELVHDLEDGDIHLPDGCLIKVQKEVLSGEKKLKSVAGRIEQFDASKLGSRVRFRTWREGDRFLPLGHNGEEVKVTRALRRPSGERIGPLWILESDERGDIAWVIGERISENYKVDKSTRSLWTFTFQSASSVETDCITEEFNG